jgi:hypothetical protein
MDPLFQLLNTHGRLGFPDGNSFLSKGTRSGAGKKKRDQQEQDQGVNNVVMGARPEASEAGEPIPGEPIR